MGSSILPQHIMVTLAFFGMILRYILVFCKGNLFLFALTSFLFFLLVKYLKRFTSLNQFLDRLDSAFFESFLIQSLLQATVHFESAFISRNFFVSLASFFIYVFILQFYLEGLILLSQPYKSVLLLDMIKVFTVLWVSFYLRLRMTSLNYFNLEIDTPTISWNELLTRLQKKENLHFVNKVSSELPITLISMKYSSYSRIRESFQSTFQKRGMKKSARDFVKDGAKTISENPSLFGGAVGATIGAGTLAYTSKQSNDIAMEQNQILKQKNEIASEANRIRQREMDIKQQEMGIKQQKVAIDAQMKQREIDIKQQEVQQKIRENDFKEKMRLWEHEGSRIKNQKQDSSGVVDQILDPHRDNDGNLRLYESKEGLKKGTKDMSLPEEDFSLAVRLDGSRVGDVFSFFI
jgi:hypothetical protein